MSAGDDPIHECGILQEKFKRNVERDRNTGKQLKELGWNLIVVWECELKKEGFLEALPGKIKAHEHGA